MGFPNPSFCLKLNHFSENGMFEASAGCCVLKRQGYVVDFDKQNCVCAMYSICGKRQAH